MKFRDMLSPDRRSASSCWELMEVGEEVSDSSLQDAGEPMSHPKHSGPTPGGETPVCNLDPGDDMGRCGIRYFP